MGTNRKCFSAEVGELAEYLPKNASNEFVKYALISQFARDVLNRKIETESEMDIALALMMVFGGNDDDK